MSRLVHVSVVTSLNLYTSSLLTAPTGTSPDRERTSSALPPPRPATMAIPPEPIRSPPATCPCPCPDPHPCCPLHSPYRPKASSAEASIASRPLDRSNYRSPRRKLAAPTHIAPISSTSLFPRPNRVTTCGPRTARMSRRSLRALARRRPACASP